MCRAAVALMSFVSSSGCCLVFQDRLPSDYAGNRQLPRCSTGGGLQVLDGIFGGVNAAAAIDEIASPLRTDADNAALIFSVGFTVLHLASLAAGHGWTNECEAAQNDFDERSQDAPPSRAPPREEEPREERREARPLPPPSRRVIHGGNPLYCAISTTDSDVGLCYVDSTSCSEARARAPDSLNTCVVRSAGSCFNASSVLDEKRLVFCSVSVKACEVDRAARATDPDYASVSPMCGIYRADAEPEAVP